MAVISIKNKTKSGSLLVGNTGYVPPSFDSIATVTVGSGGSGTVSFTSIPSTYTHLQIRGIAKTTTAGSGSDSLLIKLNNTALTHTHYLYCNGTTVTAGAAASTGVVLNTPQASLTNIFGALVIDILDYTNTNKNRTVRTLSGYTANGTGELTFWSNLYASTTAVTQVDLTFTTIAQYSSFALYGIKG